MWADFISLFSRISGFFLISPLFANRKIPLALRFGLAVTFTLLIAPPFFSTATPSNYSGYLLFLNILKEVLVGYLLGFIFSFLVEGATLAGQMVGTLSGFSAAELLNPIAISYPLFGRLFALFLFTLLLAVDLHHTFLLTLYESFTLLPVAPFPFNDALITDLIKGTARLFQHAFMYASIPFMILFLVIILFAITSRIMPNFQLFWTGFPIQLFVGIGAIILAVGYFSEILHQAFAELVHLGRRILFDLTVSM